MHYMAATGKKVNNWPIFSNILASGRFFINPGLKIDRNGKFFNCKSLSTSPFVLTYRNMELGSLLIAETNK